MDYTQRVSAGILDPTASDAIDKAGEEHGEINTTVPVRTEEKEVEAGESTQDFADQGLARPRVEEAPGDSRDTNPDAAYTRRVGFQTANGRVKLDTPDDFEKAEETKQRLEELRQVNEELERQGNKRRYVSSQSDAPPEAQVYEDDFGKYYYKRIQVDVRPSDVAEYSDVKAIVALDDDTKTIKTVELMAAMNRDPLIDASTKEAATRWLNRHLVLTDDDPGSNDTFTHEFKNQLAELIAGASKSNETEKDWRYVDDPSEAPDDVNVEEGPQGGYRYQVDGAADDGGDGDDPFNGEDPYENPSGAMYEMGIHASDIADRYMFETGDEDPESVSERVYNEVEQRVLDETGDFDVAQAVAAEAGEEAYGYAESAQNQPGRDGGSMEPGSQAPEPDPSPRDGAGDSGVEIDDDVADMGYDDQSAAIADEVREVIPEDADFDEAFEAIEDVLADNPELAPIPDDVYDQL